MKSLTSSRSLILIAGSLLFFASASKVYAVPLQFEAWLHSNGYFFNLSDSFQTQFGFTGQIDSIGIDFGQNSGGPLQFLSGGDIYSLSGGFHNLTENFSGVVTNFSNAGVDGNTFFVSTSFHNVPESSFILLAVGLLGFGLARGKYVPPSFLEKAPKLLERGPQGLDDAISLLVTLSTL